MVALAGAMEHLASYYDRHPHAKMETATKQTAIEYDISALLKDIPARIEFLLIIERLHTIALSTSRTPSDDKSLENIFDFAAYINSSPRLKGHILSFI